MPRHDCGAATLTGVSAHGWQTIFESSERVFNTREPRVGFAISSRDFADHFCNLSQEVALTFRKPHSRRLHQLLGVDLKDAGQPD